MECPSCRASAPEGARFCPSCGYALAARAEERRVVTVLFADLVGFTGLSEGVDPEQVKNLVDGAFQRLVAEVTRHGGRVDKIVGDQIMALFGAPVAHEDDAERAVRAALQMQARLGAYAEEVGVPVQIRIGLNTGEVLVGALRAGGEYTAMGDTVNVASRLQTGATPGQVLVGPLTHAQTADVIRYESLGEVYPRGRDEPVEVFAALETVAPPGQRRRRARTPLVGRDREMAILCSALTMAFERRRPQVVLLSGEAGIGKSRLAEELTATAHREHDALVLDGRCVPYGEANVWWPIAAAIRQALAIGVDDTAEQAATKIRRRVAFGLGLEPDAAKVTRTVDGLSYLLGIPSSLSDMEASRAREEAVNSLIGMLQNLASRRPLVVALSELHWADDLVLELLDRLPDHMRGLPFALIATTRSELDERWTPRSGRHNLITIHLEPLDDNASEELLGALLGGDVTPLLAKAVLERSGGNPFFLEELAGLVHESGGRELPATLRGLVATRVDSLPFQERHVLDLAAVVGRLGSVETLAALIGEDERAVRAAVDRLAAAELLSVDNGQWVFRSDLVREVAYETLTKGERARHHARLAHFLAGQARNRGREDEHVESLAHHFARAAELASELGTVDGVPADTLEHALTWIERAVAQAEQRETPGVAERLCDRALRLLPPSRDVERRQFLIRRAAARAELRRLDLARADVAAAFDEAESVGDAPAAAAALTVRGQIEQTEGALLASAADLDDAITRWQTLGDRAGEARARRLRGMTDLFLGRLTAAEANIEKALELFNELDDRRGQAWAQQNMAWISTSAGRADEAAERIQESIRLFEGIGDLTGTRWAYGLLGWVRLQQGYLEEAEELGLRVLADIEATADKWGGGMMRLLIACTRLWTGRTTDAVAYAREAREAFAAIDDTTGELRAVATLARALLAAGDLTQARGLLSAAETIAERVHDAEVRQLGRLITAGAAVQVGDAARMFDVGELLERPAGTVDGFDHGVPAAMALLQLGRTEQALPILEGVFETAGDPGLLNAAGSALALTYAVAGRPGEALALADKVDALEQGTYLDTVGAGLARGFALVQQGRAEQAKAALAEAITIADTTEDRLNQALTRLALARALEALRDPGAAEAAAEAAGALARIGLVSTDWDQVFRRACAPR